MYQYITINLMDDIIRTYESQEKATEDNIQINQKSKDHPSFKLYKLNGKHPATFLGRLKKILNPMIFILL